MTREEIAQTLKKLRINAGLTQVEAAAILGRKQQTLASWETAQSQPDANTLFTLCDIYGVSVNEAFGFNKKKNGINREEQKLVDGYRLLNNEGQQDILKYLDDKVSSGKYNKKPREHAG